MQPIILNKDYIKPFLPARKRECNKGDFGRLLIVASCRSMSGACVLATRAALRSGAGLVYTASVEAALSALRVCAPEAITLPLSEGEDGAICYENTGKIIKSAEKMDALVLGCGLSVCFDTKELVGGILSQTRIPTVIDADGINILSRDINILRNTLSPIILTPHVGEMSRLCGLSVSEIKENRQKVAADFAKKHGVTVVLKDYQTVIATPEGEIFLHNGGHPCMAKGGSGDMLAGMIGAFLAQGLSARDAACTAVFLHARAGEICGVCMGDRSPLATDLIEKLPEVFTSL